MFLEESLFIPREKGPVRWQTVAISRLEVLCTAFILLMQFCGYCQWDWENPI